VVTAAACVTPPDPADDLPLGVIEIRTDRTGDPGRPMLPVARQRTALPDSAYQPLNESPELSWGPLPEGTLSLVVTAFGADAPIPGGLWHWARPRDHHRDQRAALTTVKWQSGAPGSLVGNSVVDPWRRT
jgi:hypothetical protein